MNAPARATTSTPILRNAAGEPPLGPNGLTFRDDQGEMIYFDRDRQPSIKIGVLELENGKWLAHPPGFRVERPVFYMSREDAKSDASDEMVIRAQRYMGNDEGDGTHWSTDLGGQVIRWARALSPKSEVGVPTSKEITPAANPNDLLGVKTTVEEITDPVIAGLVAATRARQTWPAGHCFSRTNPIVNGAMKNVATCECGVVFAYDWGCYALVDAAEESHWQKFDHLPDKVDGRGKPIQPDAGGHHPASIIADGPGTHRHLRSEPAPRSPPDGAGSPLSVLRAIASGEQVEGPVLLDLAREGLVHATTTRLLLTEAGEALLKSSDGSEAADGAIGQRGLTGVDRKCQPSRREGETTPLAGVAPGPSEADAKCQACQPAQICAGSNETPSGEVTASPPRQVAKAEQAGPASASAFQSAYSLAPADPATDKGVNEDARSHAPPAFFSDDDSEFWNSPLIKAAVDLAWREVDPYEGFLTSKVRDIEPTGFDVAADSLNPALKDFQRDIVRWALRRGRAAIFAGTGLGKTLQQLVWADEISRRYGRVLILTPLAVAQQTVDEASKFGVPDVAYARSSAEITSRIVVANYERLHLFDPAMFVGVVLDESSILKSFDGKTRTVLTDAFAATQFKLCCTATPAPNDYTELGTHAEFLGVLQHKEMLATWFVHDGSSRATNVENYGQRQGSDWRLKGHAHENFWRWLATWCVMIRHPRDLGYDDVGYDLPTLHRHPHIVKTSNPETLLGPALARTMQERLTARRETIGGRVAAAAAIVNAAPDRQWLVWCNLNDESTALAAAINGATEVRGADDPDDKAARLLGFARGEIRILVSKPSIAGWGMNFQRCADMVFVGLNDSFEQLYQAIRRCWRFGQTREVNVHLISADVEGEVIANLEAKEAQADYMAEAMVGHMRGLTVKSLRSQRTISVHAVPMRLPNGHDAVADVMVAEQVIDEDWAIWNGDCVEVARGLPDESVHYTIYSPPFPALFTFSDDLRDMSNCLSVDEFWDHYEFLIEQCYRITKPGRLVTVHCMQLPTSKTRDGYIGLRDFRGQIIAAHQRAGFIYHSEVCIRKDPVQAMQRTKHIGLLHKQLAKDSAMSRMAVADYMVTLRKPGDNAEPVAGLIDRYYGNETTPCGPLVQESRMRGREILWPGDDRYSIAVWQRYAEPVWMDISPSDVLSRDDAREEKDERHISPLQLTAIRRCIDLWANEGDIVFSPFAGIGSELVTAVQQGCRGIGAELKPSYYRQLLRNLRNLKIPEAAPTDPSLFDIAALDAANIPPLSDMMEIEV
jgi:DNA modification methylase